MFQGKHIVEYCLWLISHKKFLTLSKKNYIIKISYFYLMYLLI